MAYLIALGATVLALLFRLAVAPWLLDRATLMPFLIAVLVSGWFGGMRPGLLATALGTLLGAYVLLPPEYSLSIATASDRLQLALFCAISLGICWVCESLHAARRRSQAEQRRLEQSADERGRIEETQARLASIVATSDDAIISKDLNGIIRTWNEGAQRIFGYRAEEIVGRPITVLIPAERAGEEEQILAKLRRGERCDHLETVRVAKDGRRIDVSVTISPLKDGQGRVVGASKIARDVSEHKQAEESLRRLAAELSTADRRKDEFLAVLAHELRNPLAPIGNGLQVLRLSNDKPEVVDATRAMLERQHGQLVRLVDDLLDVARINQQKLQLRRQRFDMRGVLEQAVETTRPLIDARAHQLAVQLPSERLEVDADVTRLVQVFANLINNAAKYSERGGRIGLTARREGDEVVVSVRDTGIGIPPQLLPNIFEMFVQVDRSLERSESGLGIGLTLVKRLVEMHGGSVQARSEGEGRGSEFSVRLPLLASPAQTAVPPDTACEAAPIAMRRRILVADDNEDAAASMAMMLELMGNEVVTANDGRQALEVAAIFRPEVIMLDIGMPRLNGYETSRRIRQEPWGEKTILIALTGWGQDEDKRRSQEAGFNHHLVKPVDFAALETLLSRCEAQ